MAAKIPLKAFQNIHPCIESLAWHRYCFIMFKTKPRQDSIMQTWRQRIYRIMEENHSFASRLCNVLIMTLIILNVVAIILESVASIEQEYHRFFVHFELFSVLAYTVEYILRVWVSVENPLYSKPFLGRLKHASTFMSIIDLAAILPFYLSMFTLIDARFLRVLRLLRVFKLTRHFRSLEVLMQVIRQESAILTSALFIMLILITLASGGMYVVEHDVQPEAFGSIPAAMWWAAVTLTTVGYGDVVPMTHLGKILAVFITILGLGMAAMPAGIIASGFTREIQRRRDVYQASLREALGDGLLTMQEKRQLEMMREVLGLDIGDTEAMTGSEIAFIRELEKTNCPHCGKSLFKHLEQGK